MNFIYSLTEPATLAGLLAAVASFAAIMTIALPVLSSDKLGSRLKAVAERREELRRRSRAALDKTAGARLRPEAKGLMNDIVQNLNLQKLLEDPNLQANLIQAGLRGPRPVAIFYFCRMAMPFAFAIAAWVYCSTLGKGFHIEGSKLLITVVGAAVVGFYAPTLYLKNMVQKRRDSIMRAFPDALDMLLICVESGMSIEMALARVGQEIGPASVELAEELSLTTAELSYLQERRIAYENLARRTNHPGVKSVAMALTQAERYGTPLGSALRVMAKENRELRVAEAEKKAAALPAQLTVPMIVFFLPVLFAVIMGPAIITVSKMVKL